MKPWIADYYHLLHRPSLTRVNSGPETVRQGFGGLGARRFGRLFIIEGEWVYKEIIAGAQSRREPHRGRAVSRSALPYREVLRNGSCIAGRVLEDAVKRAGSVSFVRGGAAMLDLDSPFFFTHTALLRISYRHWTGQELVARELDAAQAVRALYEAPFAVVSHDAGCDPVFTYGNRRALELFEMQWDEFTALPSRLSAEPATQEERNRLLARVSSEGYADDYAGMRISKTGRRFMIRAATLWNLIDGEGRYRGQAALIRHWDPATR